MGTIMRCLFFVVSLAFIPLNGPAFGSFELSTPTLSTVLADQVIEGHIIAKGVLVWEERLSPVNDIQVTREYLVLENSQSVDERIVLEFEPLLISIDQFSLGEKIRAHVAADGSIVSAKHIQ